jgi:hypothetical protein
MQRMVALGLAGLMVVGVWALISRLRGRKARRDLGTISESWLSDPRSYTHESD